MYPIPNDAHARRRALHSRYGGPKRDPEVIPELPPQRDEPIEPAPLARPKPITIDGWPLSEKEAAAMQRARGPTEAMLELGHGVMMRLVRIPAGRFVMGSGPGRAG